VRYDAWVNCMLSCTCDIDVRETDITSYCLSEHSSNSTTYRACACLTSRCQLKCINEVDCTQSSGFNESCWELEDVMPCDIGCAPRPEGMPVSSDRPPMMEWDFESTPCVSDIVIIKPATFTTTAMSEEVTITRVGSTFNEMYLVGGALAVILLCMCACTVWRLKRRRRKPGGPNEELPREAKQAQAGQPDSGPMRWQNADLAAVDCNTLTVAELKDLIAAGNLTSEDCLEKPELIARAEAAKTKLKATV